MTYINDVKNQSNKDEFLPDTDDTFKPSGAVTDMFKDHTQAASANNCRNCSQPLKIASKFCPKCGSKQ